jgi:hypothetical protein
MLDKNTPIEIGQHIYTSLYGRGRGVVYAIHGEQRPTSVRIVSGVMHMGGSSHFDIVFRQGGESRMLPECILRGVQWDILPEVATQAEIDEMLHHAAIVRDEKEAAEVKRKAEFAAAVENLRADPAYSYLQQDGDCHGGKLAAANIRKELKSSFPGKKFSVRVRDYGTVDISWAKGLLTDDEKTRIKTLTQKYKSGDFDGMTDSYNYSASPWNTVFGGAKYVFNQEDWR